MVEKVERLDHRSGRSQIASCLNETKGKIAMSYEVFLINRFMDKYLKEDLIKRFDIEPFDVRRIEDDRINYLVCSHDGNVKFIEPDHGEPEDNTFTRDWSWVKGALEEAYSLGLEDGKKSQEDEVFDNVMKENDDLNERLV